MTNEELIARVAGAETYLYLHDPLELRDEILHALRDGERYREALGSVGYLVGLAAGHRVCVDWQRVIRIIDDALSGAAKEEK